MLERFRSRPLSERLRRRTASGRYLPEVDGLRFLAIVPVVFQHLAERVAREVGDRSGTTIQPESFLAFVPRGGVGVSLFFVISGFIICLPYSAKAHDRPDQAPPLGYRRYLFRRVTRLEPPYLLVMFAIFAGVGLLGAVGIDSITKQGNFAESDVSLPASMAASSVYMFGLIFHDKPRLNPPAWSLEIEFQFYLIAPLLIAAFLWVGRRLWGLAAELVALVLMVLALRGAAALVLPDAARPFVVTSFVEYFVLGFALSRIYVAGYLRHPTFRRLATPTFLAGVALVVVANDGRTVFAGDVTRTVAILAGFAAVFAGSLGGGLGGWLTSRKWVSVIGGMCYSIYLIHLMLMSVGAPVLGRVLPIDDMATAFVVYGLLLVPPVLAVCAVFFVLVEKPCMDPAWPRRFWNATFARGRVTAAERARPDPSQVG